MNTKDKTGKRRPRSVPGIEKKVGKKGRTYKEAGVDIDAGTSLCVELHLWSKKHLIPGS